jgi:hypothetical protein
MNLEEELRKTRRELQAARHALQERRCARSLPITSELTVAALTAVLNHSVPPRWQRRSGIARGSRSSCGSRAQLRTAKNSYSDLRYEVWRLAQAGIQGAEWPLDALENVVRAAESSDDDTDWER